MIRLPIREPIGQAVKRFAQLLGVAFALVVRTAAQAPEGPMVLPPTVAIQQAPPSAALKVRVTLVSTPVVVRNSKGEMVHTLDAKDFQISDNSVRQQITHFDLG